MSTTISVKDQWIEIILAISRQLVLHPKKLEVVESMVDEDLIRIQAYSSGDRKKMFGRDGMFSKGISSVLEYVNRRNGSNVHLHYLEPQVELEERYPDRKPSLQWNSAEAIRIADMIAAATLDSPFRVELINGGKGEEYSSKIEIVCSQEESQDLLDLINRSLAPIFRAIGAVNGRKMLILKFRRADERDEKPSWQ